jgi:ABC-type glycerol-3-phosphate transport system substrate-binding protein
MTNITRRGALAAIGGAALARPTLAQPKPARINFVGTNAGRFHFTFVEEVAPAFERLHGIKVDFTLLPIDALAARLRAELSAGADSIDIIQWNPGMAAWLSPHLEDHERLIAGAAARNPDYDWADYLPSVKELAQYEDRQIGIPYRVTVPILIYQKPVLDAVGITRPPQTFAEFRNAAAAVTRAGAPGRFGVGFTGRQGSAMVSGFGPYLRSAGGDFMDSRSREIFINSPESVAALDFYAGLLLRDRVAAPEVTTWEFDEIIANGQNDRYAMVSTFAPYGTLMNDPALSRTAGRWAFALSPGATSIEQSKVTLGGWIMSVSRHGRHKDWALEFIQMATNKEWLRRSMFRGNAAPRQSVLSDPSIQAEFPWAPVSAEALKTATNLPQEPSWPALEQRLRVGISQTLLGQTTAKAALDAVAADWQRSLRRAGSTR